MRIELFVPGKPAPGGSKKSFRHKHTGRIVTIDDAKRNGPWRDRVATFARQVYQGPPLDGPLSLTVTFYDRRPKGHYGTGRNADRLKPSAPAHWTVKPDATKLLRSTEDALTGILWGDDAQIVDQNVSKRYADTPGAEIVLEQIEPTHTN